MGSAEIIKIDYESITNVSSRLEKLRDTIAQLKSSLQNQSQQLQSTWQGAAAVAFFQEMETVIFPTFDRLSQLLNTSSSVSSQIAKTFREAEEEAARLFNGSGSGVSTEKSQPSKQSSSSSSTPEEPPPPPPPNRAEEINRQFEEFKRNRPERSPTIEYFPSGLSGVIAKLLDKKPRNITQREADLIDALQPWEKATFEGIKDEAFSQEAKYFNTPGKIITMVQQMPFDMPYGQHV
ncbi:WXG100 family type VII secretion target [Herpetosiphon llansteffanensis]|uniref:WXG100 family type VII secretion target n=1 Tax=Herpetosiphon llansteffanensis TaxID=2094568 RepID=UPI000D7BEA8F|nr:WXG100 family type VII secretion target [Herpetosiphon llansteffanensis]